MTGAFVCGTAGEGTSLTLEERKKVVHKWVQASKGRIEIIAHIGTNWYIIIHYILICFIQIDSYCLL